MSVKPTTRKIVPVLAVLALLLGVILTTLSSRNTSTQLSSVVLPQPEQTARSHQTSPETFTVAWIKDTIRVKNQKVEGSQTLVGDRKVKTTFTVGDDPTEGEAVLTWQVTEGCNFTGTFRATYDDKDRPLYYNELPDDTLEIKNCDLKKQSGRERLNGFANFVKTVFPGLEAEVDYMLDFVLEALKAYVNF